MTSVFSVVQDIDVVSEVARKAGAAIMEIYDGDHAVEFKDDKSPLTAADKASHEVIVDGLQRHFPAIPILSEEGKSIPYEVRKKWQRFWLVDPLDGTKEFIKRNGEFTVNIALIENGTPVVGVVYVPALEVLFWGGKGKGAWRQKGEGEPERIAVRTADPAKGLTVVMSRSHPSPELEEVPERDQGRRGPAGGQLPEAVRRGRGAGRSLSPPGADHGMGYRRRAGGGRGGGRKRSDPGGCTALLQQGKFVESPFCCQTIGLSPRL